MSLYLHDIRSIEAYSTIRAVAARLPLTPFGEFELMNAVRATVIRRRITVPDAEYTLSLLRQETVGGRLARVRCEMDKVLRVASSLSHQHTYLGGHRALDILHVAIAVVLGCTDFLTFDQRQARLAQQAGLATHP